MNNLDHSPNIENPYNNQYLKHLPLIAIMAAISVLITISYLFIRESSEIIKFTVHRISPILYLLFTWFLIYRIVKKTKEVGISFITALFIYGISTYISENLVEKKDLMMNVLPIFLGLTPYIILGLQVKPKKIFYFIVFASLIRADISSNFLTMVSQYNVWNYDLFKIFQIEVFQFRINLIPFFFKYAFWFISYLAGFAFLQTIVQDDERFEDQKLNLNNRYTGFQVFIISFCSKALLFLGTFSFYQFIAFYLGKNDTISSSEFQNPYPLVILLCLIFAAQLYIIMWHYRKVMLEWFLSTEEIPGADYWLVNLPVIGGIVLFFMLFTRRFSDSLAQKTAIFNKSYDESGRKPIAYIIILLSAIQTSIAIMNTLYNPETNSITPFIAFVSLLVIISYFYTSIGLYILIVVELLLFINGFFSPERFGMGFTILITIGNAYFLMGLFHIYQFEVCPILEINTPLSSENENQIIDESN
jgi:hypothetical protein